MTIRIHDLGRAELVEGLVQRFDAEVGLQRVRDAPGQDLAGVPVHDGDEIEEPAPHRQIGDVRAPDLIRAIHPRPPEQVGIGLMPASRPAGVGLLVDRHQRRKAHQPTYPFLVHQMTVVAQAPGHLSDAEKWRFQELFIDQPHQAEVLLRLAFGRVVKG